MPAGRTAAHPAETPKSAAVKAPVQGIDVRTLPQPMVEMLEAIEIYDELLIEENAALKASDSDGVEALLERKTAATRLYQERLRVLLSDPQNTRGLPPDQRNAVIARIRDLEERTRENTILLKANMGAIEQLFQVINEAARKARRQELGYSKAGTIQDVYSRNGVSLAYNSTI
ncbi:MAG: flagellar protein FlgN [Telmatospirillum sp.]|nr:flagellar protein FlgN [Telmatospirillum sp.]